MQLPKPLIKMEPDEVEEHLKAGNITEDDALGYVLKRQVSDDFYGMDPDDVKLSLQKGIISEEDAHRYVDRNESGFVGYYTKETGRGLAHGVRGSFSELLETVDSLNRWFADKIGSPMPEAPRTVKEGDDVLQGVQEPGSTYGKIVGGVTQGVTGFALTTAAVAGAPGMAVPSAFSKFPKTFNFLKAVTRGAGKGAVVDATMFDPKAGRFADFLDEFGYKNLVVDWLKTDPGDTELEGRLKNVIEGFGFGIAAEGVFMGLKATKRLVWAKNAGDPSKIAEDVASLVGKQPITEKAKLAAPNMAAGRADVDNIMQAMAVTESGDRFFSKSGEMLTAKDSGMGKWQIMPDTWKDWSMKKWGEVREVTPKNQEELVRWRVEQLVDEGYTPQQIASIWNSGRPEWEGRVGVNKWGVTYDVPKHVERFTKNYNKIVESGPQRGYAQGMLELKYEPEKVDRFMKLGDALAETISKRTGITVEDWWANKFGDVRFDSVPEALDNPLFHWAGPKATGFAKALEEGRVVRGKDGKLRFDIDDSELKWSDNVTSRVVEGKPVFKGERNLQLQHVGTLGDSIVFDKLFENYPHMRDIPVYVDIKPKNSRSGVHTYFEDGKANIRVEARTLDEGLEVLVHEMQHNTQYIEDWAKGGASELFDIEAAKARGNTEEVGFMLNRVRQTTLKKLKETPGSAVAKIEELIKKNRKARMELFGEDGKLKPGAAEELQTLEQQAKIYTKGQRDAVQMYLSRNYNNMDPYTMYRHLFGEQEARDAANRFMLRKGGVDVDGMGHLETLPSDEVSRGIVLSQGEKGAVQFMDDGEVILHLFETADFSTLVHELGHMIRRDLDGELKEVVDNWAGVTDGVWRTDQEEEFAKAFERFLASGKAPKPELKTVFEEMKQWLLAIYEAVTKISSPVSKELEDVFTKLLGGEPEKKLFQLPVSMQKSVDLFQGIRDIAEGKQYTPKDLEDGGPFNLMKMCTADEIHKTVSYMADMTQEEMAKATRGTVSFESTARGAKALHKQWAEMFGAPLEEAQSMLSGVRYLDRKLNAHMSTLISWQEAVAKLARGAKTDEEKLVVALQIQELAQYQALVKGAQTEVARGLSSLRMLRKGMVDMTQMKPEDIAEATKKSKKLDTVVKTFAELKSPAEQASFARKLGRNRVLEGILEFRQAALLSGLGTHVANMLGNALSISLEATNRVIANTVVGLGELASKGETHRIAQNLKYTTALVKGAIDTLRISSTGRAALWGAMTTDGKVRGEMFTKFLDEEPHGNFWKALLTSDPQIDPMTKFEGQGGGAIPKWALGPIIRLPFRLLTAADEFFKGTMYRAELTFNAIETGTQVGKKGKDLDEFVRLVLENPDNEMHVSALKKAREVTFSDNLEGMAKKLNDGLNQSSLGIAARIMTFPFVKVAVNMMKFTSNRTVGFLPGINRRFMEDISAGGTRRAEAVVRLATGNMLVGLGAYLYHQGKITGATPHSQRDAWENAKIQQNSVLSGNTFTSYNRAEPMSAFVRIGADVARLIEQRELPEDQQESLLTGAMMILANQLNSTYMKSVAEFVQIFSMPERMNPAKWLNRQAGTFFPASGAFAQANRGEGELVRDVSPELDLWDSFLGTFNPDRLHPRRHSVYGTTIEQEERLAAAFNRSTVDDPVTLEMARVGANVGPLDRKLNMGGVVIELDDEQYQKLQDTISRLPIRESLEKIISSPGYQQTGSPDKQAQVLKDAVGKARELAKKQYVSGNPEVTNDLREKYQRKADAILGIHHEQNPKTRFYHWMEYLRE